MKSQSVGFGYFVKTYLSVIFSVLLAVFLLANIVASQTVSPLYFNLVSPPQPTADKFQNAITFLIAIESLPQYQEHLNYYRNLYGETIVDSVSGPKRERLLLLQSFEQILQKNPKSRDILYSLSVFYRETGDEIKAEEYLRQAKDLDPAIESVESF